jgi:hypothetical protein
MERFASESADSELKQPQGTYPILVRLIDFEKYLPTEGADLSVLKTYLMAQPYLKTADVPLAIDAACQAVQDGNAYLYLDGFDEVDVSLRYKLKQWINSLPIPKKGAIVLSTRFTDYRRRDLARRFEHWEIRPMDGDIQQGIAHELLPRYWRVLNKDRYSRETAQIPMPNDEQFVKFIEDNPNTRIWAGNPLIFTMAAYFLCAELGRYAIR